MAQDLGGEPRDPRPPLGIVGYGNIGSQLSVLAEALGMSVSFYDTDDRLALGRAQRRATMADVLAEADVLSLHVDGRPANAGLLGGREIARMKRGAILLNLSRGSVVDLTAVRAALLDGRLSGAAIDVFPDEPDADGPGFVCDLQGLPNVMLTPHIAGSTEEAQREIGLSVAERLRSHLAQRTRDNRPVLSAS